MSSKSKRRNARAKRRGRSTPSITDPHVRVAVESIAGISSAMAEFGGADDPVCAVEARMTAIVNKLTAQFRSVDPARIIEIARLACLPWPWATAAAAEGGPARAELLALLAVAAATAASAVDDAVDIDIPAVSLSDVQPLTNLVAGVMPQIETLLELAQARELVRSVPTDSLDKVAAAMRGTEVWMRNTSYPEMVAETVRLLFADPHVLATLRTDLGFDADQALTVLGSCHALQVRRMTGRLGGLMQSVDEARQDAGPGGLHPEKRGDLRRRWTAAWDAESDAVTVSVEDLVVETGLALATVSAVLDHFHLDIGSCSPARVVDEFIGGNNPLRASPVIRTPSGRAMLVHDAQIGGAVRESLEQYLKQTAVWEVYQRARGEVLERRTRAAFERVLPQATFWDGFEYYVPADATQEQGGPDGYRKKVEGDHLILQDDVAIIVEDKAVAVSPRSRAGETGRLRGNLTDIITKASEQAGRLQDRIQQDGGIRLHSTGWLDLSHIREIHTVAVSLDDLPGVSTTTAELVQAGLLDAGHIPWTVSLHDLDLITTIVDLPAEFLLYLRRRRDPNATVIYYAPDELDLFLYFFDKGLYVEPDPDKVRELLPFMPPPTTAERRRFRNQQRTYIATRTDPLDAWYQSTLALAVPAGEGGGVADSAMSALPKPRMAASPLHDLIVTIQQRGCYAWLSIGAALLSGASDAQAKLARTAADLLANPRVDGHGRSATFPFASDRENGWLLVWMTRPVSQPLGEFEQLAHDYLRVKKHQLSLPRGVAFLYDEGTKELIDVVYDGHVGELEQRLRTRLAQLHPADRWDKSVTRSPKRRTGTRPGRR